MATTAPMAPQLSATKTHLHSPKLKCIKSLAESAELKSIPSDYAYTTNPNEAAASDPDESMPVIDFSLLTSADPHQRSKTIQDLGTACQDWGFFMLINHGVPESLIKGVLDGCMKFFNLPEEEKREFQGKDLFDPIRMGSSIDGTVMKSTFWRDFLKAFVHPEFHFPNKPSGFSELSMEYCKRAREVSTELLKGILESLGLEEDYMYKNLDWDSGLQMFAVNLYPPCPQPDIAMGIPPHTDHGLVTLLVQNEIGGLQVLHNDKWFNVNALPNSFLVNVADQLEVVSNGKYKSIMHRAVVNNKSTRISIAMPNGPSLHTSVSPAEELLNNETNPPAYSPMTYKQFLEFQQCTRICLDRVRIKTV